MILFDHWSLQKQECCWQGSLSVCRLKPDVQSRTHQTITGVYSEAWLANRGWHWKYLWETSIMWLTLMCVPKVFGEESICTYTARTTGKQSKSKLFVLCLVMARGHHWHAPKHTGPKEYSVLNVSTTFYGIYQLSTLPFPLTFWRLLAVKTL